MKKLLCLFLLLPACLGAQSIVRNTTAMASASGAPLTFSFTSRPIAGHMLVAYVAYNVYGDYDILPPDQTWSCTLGGRGTATSIRINTCTHVVVPNDATSFTFTSNTSAGQPAPGGMLVELAGVVSAQLAYAAVTSPEVTVNTPGVTPARSGSLAMALVAGSGLAPAPSGWSLLAAGNNEVVQNTLTSGANPVSASMNVGSTYNNSLAETAVFAPGTFTTPSSVSPAAGSYNSVQSVQMSCTTPGCTSHYTMDGTAASCSSTTYTFPLQITATTMVSSIVCAPGYAPSAVTYSNFIIKPGTLTGVALGNLADLNGYVPWSGDLWHQRIDGAQVDPNSSGIMALLETTRSGIRHDWSSTGGIPYTVVDSTKSVPQAWTPLIDNTQSDVSFYPFPTAGTLLIEGTPPACTLTGDNHTLIIDRANAALYELYHTQQNCPGYRAEQGTIFDLNLPTSMQRPYTYTSADAGGLSVFEGLVRYDEVAAGLIPHAIRFTSKLAGAYEYQGDGYGYFEAPALHSAPTGGQATNANNVIDYGMRIRLKQSFNISGYPAQLQVILQAMKDYGLILADLSSNTFDFEGTPDPRWNDTMLAQLDGISASNFEVVRKGTLEYGALGNYPTGSAPTITSFTASPATVLPGQCSTLRPVVSGQTSMYIDKVGFVRGAVSVCPTQTTTYELTTNSLFLTNDDGFGDGVRPTATATVSVIGSPASQSAPLTRGVQHRMPLQQLR